METSAQEESTRSTTRPLASLTPIRETRSSLESQPQTPTDSSIQNSPSYGRTSRQKNVEIVSGYPSPGPSREVKSQTSLQLRDKGPDKVPPADQWEDIEEKEPRHSLSGRRRTWSRESVGDRDQDGQTERKLKNLAWRTRLDDEGTFKSFSQLQVLLLFHAQHDLVLQLEEFDSRKRGSRKQMRSQLHQYRKYFVLKY
jgi:hypothetical protein